MKNAPLLLDWSEAVRSLVPGVDLGALPTILPCPKCHGPGRAWPGGIAGPWLSCQACDTNDDVVGMAAAVWQTSPGLALATLRQHQGLAPPSAEDVKKIKEIRDRRIAIDELWSLASSQMGANHARARELHIDVFVAGLSGRRDFWAKRGGRIVGYLSRDQLVQVVPAARRVMAREAAWAIVSPMHSAPGRIERLLVAWRDDETNRPRWGFVEVGEGDGWPALGCWHGRDTATNLLYVLVDPIVAIDAQLHSFEESDDWLPLVFVDPRGPTAETIVPAVQRTIVWARDANADMYRHARAVDALVRMDPSVSDATTSYQARTTGSTYWTHRTRGRLPTWRESLEDRLLTATPEEVERLVFGIGLSGQEVSDLVLASGPRVEKSMDGPRRQAAVPGVAVVREACDGWYAGDMRISNTRVVIERLVRFPGRTDRTYEGQAIVGQRILPFRVPASAVEAGPRWLEEVLLDAGLVLELAPKWAKALVPTALALRPPQVIDGVASPGWSMAHQAFIWPEYAVGPRGVDDHPPPCLRNDFAFVRPCQLTPDELELLGGGTSKSSLAGMFVALADMLTGPIISATPHNLVLACVGQDRAAWARKTLDAIGLTAFAAGSTDQAAAAVRQAMADTAGVLYVTLPTSRRKEFMQWWPSEARRCVLLCTDLFEAAALGMREDWHLVVLDDQAANEEARYALARALANYVADIAGQVSELWPDWCARTAAMQWLTERAGAWPNAGALYAADQPEKSSRCLALAVQALVRSGATRIAPIKFAAAGALVAEDDDATWVDVHGLSALARQRGCGVLIEHDDARRALEAAGVFGGEQTVQGRVGLRARGQWLSSVRVARRLA